jgi:hypothetical protein
MYDWSGHVASLLEDAMRHTIDLPDEQEARVNEYLERHPTLTLASIIEHGLDDVVPPTRQPSILDLAGFVDVDTFESPDKAMEFADRPEDQFVDRTR